MRPIAVPPGSLILVAWEDIATLNQWSRADEIERWDNEDHVCMTSGWVRAVDQHRVLVVSSAFRAEGPESQSGDITRIPWSVIRAMEILRPAPEPMKRRT